MTKRFFLATIGLGVLALAVLPRASQADDPVGKDKAPSKPPTVKAESGPMVRTVTLKGVVEAAKGTEIGLRPKAWIGGLTVKSVVEHGTAVKAGQTLIEFETDKIDLAIRDAKQERELAALSIRQSELELPIAERQFPLDLAQAERDARQAEEDLKKFLDVDKPLSIESANQQLKSSAFFLETAKDEFKQLSKMYKDKDLTEETEEIVLKRYKHNLESSEFGFKAAKIRHEQTIKIDLPRREQTAKDTLAKAQLALAKARDVSPIALQQKKLGLVKAKYEEAKARERLADLEKDKAAMTIVAPADGIVYHGRNVRGQWMPPMGPMGGLNVGGNVMTGDPFMTVLTTGNLTIRADAEEKDLPGLTVGLTGKATATAAPDQKMAVRVSKVAGAPLMGKFEIQAEITGDAAKNLVPGMTCTLRFVTARKERAVTVPASAVFEDEADESKYVYLPGKDGKGEKKTVTTGLTIGDKVEITDGLTAGTEILATKPAAGGAK